MPIFDSGELVREGYTTARLPDRYFAIGNGTRLPVAKGEMSAKHMRPGITDGGHMDAYYGHSLVDLWNEQLSQELTYDHWGQPYTALNVSGGGYPCNLDFHVDGGSWTGSMKTGTYTLYVVWEGTRRFLLYSDINVLHRAAEVYQAATGLPFPMRSELAESLGQPAQNAAECETDGMESLLQDVVDPASDGGRALADAGLLPVVLDLAKGDALLLEYSNVPHATTGESAYRLSVSYGVELRRPPSIAQRVSRWFRRDVYVSCRVWPRVARKKRMYREQAIRMRAVLRWTDVPVGLAAREPGVKKMQGP